MIKIVKVIGRGKYYCNVPKEYFSEECEYKTKTGLCRARDLTCTFMKYDLIVKINNENKVKK